ncbi:hypothetical protein NUSPORA_00016 [Nucleospora cyclopteri]
MNVKKKNVDLKTDNAAVLNNELIKFFKLDSENGIPFDVISELKFIKSFNHTNIAQIADLQIDKFDFKICYEKLDLNLQNTIKKNVKITKEAICALFCQSVDVLSELHHKGEIYGNLCPKNCYVNNEGTIKFVNFKLKDSEDYFYQSPERLLGQLIITEKEDSWALASLIFELITGQKLFKANDRTDLAKEIFRKIGSIKHDFPVSYLFEDLTIENYIDWGVFLKEALKDHIQEDFCSILIEMLALDKSKRLSCKHVKELPFYTENKNKRFKI